MMLKKTIYRHINDVNYDDITDFKTKLQELIQADQRKTLSRSRPPLLISPAPK